MDRRDFLKTLSAAGIASGVPSGSVLANADRETDIQRHAEKPNVILILADDMGPWVAGCYGNPEIQTPNIDRLAADGMRFENFFCTSPVCSPAKAPSPC